jgi:hypothetical protein
MNNPLKVHNYLKRTPLKWHCDDCVAKATGVNRHQVNTIASTLALFPKEFVRQSATCSMRCSDRDKIGTQAL